MSACANLVSELLAVISGVLLFISAVALNAHLKKIRKTRALFDKASRPFSRKLQKFGAHQLDHVSLPAWSEGDELRLVMALAAFLASAVIKLVMAFGPADGPITSIPVGSTECTQAATAGATCLGRYGAVTYRDISRNRS